MFCTQYLACAIGPLTTGAVKSGCENPIRKRKINNAFAGITHCFLFIKYLLGLRRTRGAGTLLGGSFYKNRTWTPQKFFIKIIKTPAKCKKMHKKYKLLIRISRHLSIF
jgi:hypothetical protein